MEILTHIMVVGTGGTGGNYLKELARYVYSLPNNARRNIDILVVDGDTVEERNIARQPFMKEDVGMNKAVAMSTAIQEVFPGVNIVAFPIYLETAAQLDSFWMNQGRYGVKELYVIVGCVDNHHARKIMHDYFNKPPKGKEKLVYIDSANEYSVGEVVTAFRNGRGKKHIVAPPRQYYYPDIFKKPLVSVSELGCVEVNEVAPQHLVTNMLAANILLAQTVELFQGKIRCGITYFDAMSSNSRFVEYRKDE